MQIVKILKEVEAAIQITDFWCVGTAAIGRKETVVTGYSRPIAAVYCSNESTSGIGNGADVRNALS